MSEKIEEIIAEARAEESAETLETERAQVEQAQAEAAASIDSEAGEIASMIEACVALAVPMYPKLEKVYTKETCERLGKVTAALAAKYGWTVGGFFERWGVEVAFAVTVVPVAIQTAKIVREGEVKPASVTPSSSAAQAADDVPAPALVIGSPSA